MFVTIITDCADQNAQGRQETRARVLFDVTPAFIALPGTLDLAATLEASGNLIDVLDAGGGEEGVVLVNVAPRHTEKKKWDNGSPFAYFRYKRTLVVGTISGFILSLPHAYEIVEDLTLIDLPGTVIKMWEGGLITEEESATIPQSQFRSFDFLPRVAAWISRGHDAVAAPFDVESIPAAPTAVWSIDNFGNIKTTMRASELGTRTSLETRLGTLPIVRSLKDVAEGDAAVIVGSSGMVEDRMVEVVIQGGNAAKKYGTVVGDLLIP